MATEDRRPATVPYMSISLDGFVAGPDEDWETNPLGGDGGYLHGWFPAGVTPKDPPAEHAAEESTGGRSPS